MQAKLQRLIDLVRTGFWFVPFLMLFSAAALALVLLYVDERVDPGIKATLAWAYSGGPEGARSLLSTVAGSMITAASVTFSLASVALSIASQQYGSRVLRNFMRDRVTQVLLGTFVSTFLYSVLVVRAIRGSDFSGGFVPAISVTVAILLSVLSLVLLVYFVHHVSSSIQASQIVRTIATNMEEVIPRLYPSEAGNALQGAEPHFEELHGGGRTEVSMEEGGYLQTIDLDKLMEVAKKGNFTIEARIRPGDHLVDGGCAAIVWGRSELDKKTTKLIQEAFFLGGERTPAQDIRYQFQQLSDVVIRALSPGINDPFTAINGIDELGSGLVMLAKRPRVVRSRMDQGGHLRLVIKTVPLSEIFDQTIGHIAIYAAADRFVMAKLREVMEAVSPWALEPDEKEMLAALRVRLDLRETAQLKKAGIEP